MFTLFREFASKLDRAKARRGYLIILLWICILIPGITLLNYGQALCDERGTPYCPDDKPNCYGDTIKQYYGPCGGEAETNDDSSFIMCTDHCGVGVDVSVCWKQVMDCSGSFRYGVCEQALMQCTDAYSIMLMHVGNTLIGVAFLPLLLIPLFICYFGPINYAPTDYFRKFTPYVIPYSIKNNIRTKPTSFIPYIPTIGSSLWVPNGPASRLVLAETFAPPAYRFVNPPDLTSREDHPELWPIAVRLVNQVGFIDTERCKSIAIVRDLQLSPRVVGCIRKIILPVKNRVERLVITVWLFCEHERYDS